MWHEYIDDLNVTIMLAYMVHTCMHGIHTIAVVTYMLDTCMCDVRTSMLTYM